MKWILVYITMSASTPDINAFAEYDTMEECFHERDVLVEALGRPIVNYQAVCVQADGQG